jgi:hypothetical protein
VVKQCRIFRWRVCATSVSDRADFCTSEFVWMRSTLWNDQNLFLTTLKIRISPKTLLFSDERGSDTNCWWERPLVVALKHSKGIKHTVLFQEQKAYNTHPLFLSFFLVFLSTLSTQNNIGLATYLYTNSKLDNSAFKCEGGWRMAV